jgi:hypothetical protein
MQAFQSLIDRIQQILTGEQETAESAPDASPVPAPEQEKDDTPTVPLPRLEGPPPTIDTPENVERLACIGSIRPDLGTVNIRSGPGLSFDRIERASGGMAFGIAGVSGPDADGLPWYWIEWDGGSGWVRSDLMVVGSDCHAVDLTPPEEPEPPAEPPAGVETVEDQAGRFPMPVPHALTQGYHNHHQGYDLGSPVGTPLHAPAPGVVIRRLVCTRCTTDQPNVSPGSLTTVQRQQVFADAGWGFGYGNCIIVRYDYADMPSGLQAKMDAESLTGGFAYVLYAHLRQIAVNLGDAVAQGDPLGETGNTGHSSGPHLHMEVRIGDAETVDGRWQTLQPVNPDLMFF